MSKIILGLTGRLASGKTTLCDYLEDKYNAQIFGFSAPLRDILNRLYLPQTRENLQSTSQALREYLGQDVLAKALSDDANSSTAEIVIVDGVRRPKDIEHLSKLDNFYLINIKTEQETRYKRIIGREQNVGDGDLTYEKFKENDSAEAESLIDEVAKQAKFTIDNNGTKEELIHQIEDIINKIK